MPNVASSTIVVIGDTHTTSFEKLPPRMLQAITEADWVIHVGDYTSKDVFDGLARLKGNRFRGVYGNTDPLSIRFEAPIRAILEIHGKRIGITHPAAGGAPEGIEARLIAEFREYNVNAIVYGHIHEPKIMMLGGILLINPGKGYMEKSYFGAPTSFAVITVGEEIKAKITSIQS